MIRKLQETIQLKNLEKSYTEPSNKFLKMKDNNDSTNIIWGILARQQAYSTSAKRCSLCSNEKLKIALHTHTHKNLLSQQTEI